MLKVTDTAGPIRIGIYLARKFSIVPFINAIDPLRMANRICDERLFEWTLISRDGEPVEAINGMSIVADCSLKDAGYFPNAICCVGFEPVLSVGAPVKSWLRMLDSKGAHLGALGAGSIFLAEAGLLDGYRATIHWQFLDSFIETYPRIEATRNLFEIDRDRFTCAGGTAAMDLVLHLISVHFGHNVAAEVSDQFIMGEIRNAENTQRTSNRFRLGITNPRVLQVVDLMEGNIEDPIPIARLAAQVGISQRQLERMFKEHVKTSAVRYYRRIRLLHARRLLLQSELPLIEVAVASGFGSLEHFSRTYKAEFGKSPQEDRRPGMTISTRRVLA